MGASNYKIKLKTVGPIHIGNGRQLGKKDYFLHKESIAILETPRFIEKLTPEQLAAYCNYLQETGSEQGLQHFLEEHQLSQVAASAIAYQIDTRLSRAKRGTYQFLDVFEFVKDPYGCPYIPGASFKGMLRTVLLAQMVSANRQRYLEEYPKGSNWRKDKNAGRNIERAALWVEQPDPTNPYVINDIMRFVSVSDSKPLSTKCLTFVKKYDKFAKRDDASHKRRMGNQSIGGVADGNELNIYRECLKPGTIIEFSLSIDDRINDFFLLNQENLVGAFEQFAARYKECFLDHFEDLGVAGAPSSEAVVDSRCIYVGISGIRCRNPSIEGSCYCRLHQEEAKKEATSNRSTRLTCYLGGGVDFDSKTLLNALFEDDGRRLSEISHILDEQFPTKINLGEYAGLKEDVEDADFSVKASRFSGKKKKEDHRHWKDQQLGVSPHTLKLGKIGKELLPMGRCDLTIERAN